MKTKGLAEYHGTLSHLWTGTISDLADHLNQRITRYQDRLDWVLATIAEESELIRHLLENASEMGVRVIPKEVKQELLDSSTSWFSSSSTNCFGLGKNITIPMKIIELMLGNLPGYITLAKIERSIAHELGHQIQDDIEPLLPCMVGLASLPDWDVITFYHQYCPYREARAEEEGLGLIKKFLGPDAFYKWLRQPEFSFNCDSYLDLYQKEMAANRINFNNIVCSARSCPRLSAISACLSRTEDLIAS